MNYKKFAFTLSETLVTLAIIGVVMALMLRSVNRVSPNKEKLLFLKSYRALEQAIEETINDQDKYDQVGYGANGYNKNEDGTQTRKTGIHEDFRDAPSQDYVAYVNGTEFKNITKEKAVCVFLAEHMNILGEATCSGNGGFNFKTTNGVCFGNWDKVDAQGEVTGYIQPECETGTTYTVKVFHDGKVTVPNDSAAFGWMSSQTDLN